MNSRRIEPAKSTIEQDTIARVEKTPPSHAKGMRELVGIGIGVRQGEPYGAMRVDFELNCGTASLRINGGEFVVSMRTCFVVLELENCEILPHSRYEHRLASGTVEATETETRDRSDSREGGIGADAGVEASPKTGLLAKLSLSGNAKRTKKIKDSTQEVVKRQPRMDLVVAAGQDRWQVGDPRVGDARRPDGRLIGSYFGEDRDEAGEPRALCVVAGGSESTSTMTASVVVRFGQLMVHLGTEPVEESQREDLDSELKKRGRQVAAAHRAHADDLRTRIAGLVLAKAMHAAHRHADPPADGEVLVARQALEAAPRHAMRAAGEES